MLSRPVVVSLSCHLLLSIDCQNWTLIILPYLVYIIFCFSNIWGLTIEIPAGEVVHYRYFAGQVEDTSDKCKVIIVKKWETQLLPRGSDISVAVISVNHELSSFI